MHCRMLGGQLIISVTGRALIQIILSWNRKRIELLLKTIFRAELIQNHQFALGYYEQDSIVALETAIGTKNYLRNSNMGLYAYMLKASKSIDHAYDLESLDG